MVLATSEPTPAHVSLMLASDMPTGATDYFNSYAPHRISTINTGITAEDLDWLIIGAMQRAEGDGEEVLHSVTRQRNAPSMRTLAAKQYKRSKKERQEWRPCSRCVFSCLLSFLIKLMDGRPN
jgi:hypothetical protein